MQKQSAKRQRFWAIETNSTTVDRALELALDLKSGTTFGDQNTITINLSGSPLGWQLSGDPHEVANEFAALDDKRFLAINISAKFPTSEGLGLAEGVEEVL